MKVAEETSCCGQFEACFPSLCANHHLGDGHVRIVGGL